MIDIFKLFRVETKEDIYTYCLITMLENGNPDFKKRVGEQFGFEGDYQIIRKSFDIPDDSDVKKKTKTITPDFVLYNSNHVSIVESKMFSSEGWSQTEDYSKGGESIKNELSEESASVAFYFLTLSGILAESKFFTPIKWTDFYEVILKDTIFKDETLEIIRKTILTQVEKYRKFERALLSEPYRGLFDKETYWITPLTLLSSGAYNNIWQTISGEEPFYVSNIVISGHGHSEFVTDLEKLSWKKIGVGECDNIHLFIRIEWCEEQPIVWLCWEYCPRYGGGYIATSKIEPPDFRNRAIEFLRSYKDNWEPNKLYTRFNIQRTDKKASSIKALKCVINGDEDISGVIDGIKTVVLYYSQEINSIINAFFVTDECLTFDIQEYKRLNKEVLL